MVKRPKTRVKARKAKKRLSKKDLLQRPKRLPVFSVDFESASFSSPLTCDGAVTGRVTYGKPLEKMSRKELLDTLDLDRKQHEVKVKELQDELEVQRQLAKRTGWERDDAMRVRDQLLTILDHGSKAERFPRNS